MSKRRPEGAVFVSSAFDLSNKYCKVVARETLFTLLCKAEETMQPTQQQVAFTLDQLAREKVVPVTEVPKTLERLIRDIRINYAYADGWEQANIVNKIMKVAERLPNGSHTSGKNSLLKRLMDAAIPPISIAATPILYH
jgi:hypothetical protein